MTVPTPLRAAAFLLIIHHSSLITSAQEWLLSTADFRTEPVALQAIDEKGVRVIPAGQTKPKVVPAESFLQLERDGAAPVGQPAKLMLHLLTGDRVGGEPVKIENDRMLWRNASVGEISIPLAQALAFTQPGQTPETGARTEDVVVLGNGDTVGGIVTGVSARDVQVKSVGSDDAPSAVPLDAVVAVYFANSGGPATKSATRLGPTYRVRLTDGSTVVATSLTLVENKLAVALGGGEPRRLELSAVSAIEQVNGPVSWLNARPPGSEVQIPFVGIGVGDPAAGAMWTRRTDVDVAGQPFVLGGKQFKRGIGVHSYSRLVYPLDGSYKAFRTRYGINDSLVRADVTVRVKLGDKVVHEARNVRAGAISPVVVVDLGAAKELTLEVDYGDGIDVEDRLNWIEPALLREKPTAEQPTTAPTTRPAK